MTRLNYSLKELEALRAVLTTGTTTAAAKRLGISQPAVSRSLSHLEARMNTTLFQREGLRLVPTAEALTFNRRLDGLFDALSDIEGTEERDELETLRVAAPPTLSHRFLTERIASFAENHPAGLIKMEICTSEEVAIGVIEQTFDIGISSTDEARAGLKLLPFRRSRTMFAAKAGHPLDGRDIVAVEDLDGLPYVAVTRRHAWRRWYDGLFDAAGVVPRVTAEVGTAVAAVELAQRGLGFTLINPFPIIKRERSRDLVLIPMEQAFEHRTSFVTAADRPLNNISRAFMRHVRLTLPKDGISQTIS